MLTPVTAIEEQQQVLSFWFGELDAQGRADDAHTQRWFKKDSAFDDAIRREFSALHHAVASGERETWLDDARGRIAYVIVLDQFSRNMFRNDPRTYASDDQALRAALDGVKAGDDRALADAERYFLYMPFMHSESLAMQDKCVALFEAWAADGNAQAKGALKWAREHRDVVARFGRFPHRNAVLGRASTKEEADFLKDGGASF